MKPTQRIAIILSAGLLLAAPSCGTAANNASTSASVSVAEHEFTPDDLSAIFTLPSLYISQNSTNVVLASALEYDDSIITSITGGAIDTSVTGKQDIYLTITVDKAALAEAIGLAGEFSGEATIQYKGEIEIIAEDAIAELLTSNPDAVVLGTDNMVYELTDDAESSEETPAEASSAETTTEPTNTTEPAATTTTSTPKVTTSGSSKVTTSSSKVSSTTTTTPAANNKTNTTTTNTNSNKGNTATSGSTSSNTGSGTTSSNKFNTTSTTTKTDTKKDTTTSTSTSTKTDTSTCKTDTNKKPETTTTTTTPAHTHSWKAVYKTVHHDEVGHNETKTVTAAYDEPVYEVKNKCSECDYTSTKGGDMTIHGFEVHDGKCSYSADYFLVDTIHHDAVTETVYVVDQTAYDEQVVDHYECSCGATK